MFIHTFEIILPNQRLPRIYLIETDVFHSGSIEKKLTAETGAIKNIHHG